MNDSSVHTAPQLEQAKESTQSTPKKFPVIEIFGPVIQGEGSQAGQQTMFIRFGGCDYKCAKCDSMHAVDPRAVQKHATYLPADEIVAQLEERRNSTGVRWVTLSGGNPCMHKLDVLVGSLRALGWFINVETQATLWQEWIRDCHVVTISPKSMGMGEKFEKHKLEAFLAKLSIQPQPLCVKVVVFTPADFEMALHIKGIVDVNTAFWHPGMVSYYLSLGNPFPPVLNEELDLVENPALKDMIGGYTDILEPSTGLKINLLADYKHLSEEVLLDPRLKDFRFLPQLHVLVYGNETGR